MIFIGYNDQQKTSEIEKYRQAHEIHKVVVISADAFPLLIEGSDQIKYSDVIMYVTFYRLLQEINQHTLIILNECLRTQNRYDLTYNCIRQYLNQTGHQLIFQQLPQIDSVEDFMILFDFDTGSRWKRQKFDINLVLDNAEVMIKAMPIAFEAVNVPTSKATIKKYEKERDKRFASLGNKDPHTIPRNLYLIGGKDKVAYIDSQESPLFASGLRYVARNKRLNRDSIVTYSDIESGQYLIVELPHRFIEFCDFLKVTNQAYNRVLLADLKVDSWYFQRYTEWGERVHETYAALQQ